MTPEQPPKAADRVKPVGVTDAMIRAAFEPLSRRFISDVSWETMMEVLAGYERARTAAPSAPSGDSDRRKRIHALRGKYAGKLPTVAEHLANRDDPAPIVSPEGRGEPVGKTLGFPYADKWGDMLTNVVLAKGHTNIAPDTQLFTHPAPTPTGDAAWLEKFEELLEDYAGARAETAAWNVTQKVQPENGVRMPRPRKQALMAHVALRAHPQPQAVGYRAVTLDDAEAFIRAWYRPRKNSAIHRITTEAALEILQSVGFVMPTPPTDSAKGEK